MTGVPSLVNSVQTNGSVPMPLHKRDLDVQTRGTHRKSDSVRIFCMTLDTVVRHSLKRKNGKQITFDF